MEKRVSIREIVKYLHDMGTQFEIVGNIDECILGFSSIDRYRPGTITWISTKREVKKLPFHISVCIVHKDVEIDIAAKIITPDPKAVFFSVLDKFWGDNDEKSVSIGEGSVIGNGVKLGERVQIGCNCSIIGDIHIGDGTQIGDNVVIKNKVNIGHNCIIQSLSVIGEDGYGYSEDEFHVKTMVKHYGGVIIGDDVFIGNHTNIARGTIDDTIIGNGTKIAPSTHIGHNNCIGENVAIICSKLFGSVKVGDNSYISSSIIRNQSRVGSDVIVGMGAVVTKDIENGKVVMGIPAKIVRENKGSEKL